MIGGNVEMKSYQNIMGSDLNKFSTQFDATNTIRKVEYQSNTDGLVRFSNDTTNVTGIDIEKEAGAKMITESRKEFYIRQGISEVRLGRE